jgi:hypothetical protein
MTSIENICGNQPDGFVKLDISSDPNFVFVNDPSYSTKQLLLIPIQSVSTMFLGVGTTPQ